MEAFRKMSNLQAGPSQQLVSIVINNCNYGRFLGAAIRSALAQSYTPLEVIVVDDGSTDNSREVMESFGGQITPIFKANGGQASAYNAGWRVCRGEFVHFLDSDDLLDPAAIEEAVRLWEPGVAKVHFRLRVVEGLEAEPTESRLPASALAHGDVRSLLTTTGSYTSPPGSGNFYWRPVLDGIFPMPERDWITAADTYPVFLAPLFGEVRACRDVLGSYRVHGANDDARTEISGKLLRYRLLKETHRDALFLKFCPMAGLAYSSGAVANDLGHMKIRLSSLLLGPSSHPYPEDRVFQIAKRTATLCWRKKTWPVRKRLLFILWIVYVLCAPQAKRSRAINLAFAPTSRSKIMQRMTSKTEGLSAGKEAVA